MSLSVSPMSFDWDHKQLKTYDDIFFVFQAFQPMFCWNAQAWSLQVSWVMWSWCLAQGALCAQFQYLCPLILANKGSGVSQSSALPLRASSSRLLAKTRRATASRGCPVSRTPTSFQARQPLPLWSHSAMSLAPHQSLSWPVTCFLPCVDPPAVSMPNVVKGFYMQPTAIGCSVESDIPYRLRFTRSGITLGEEKLFQWVFPLCALCNIWLSLP